MKAVTYGWITWAAVNAAAAHAAGIGLIPAAAVTVAANTRTVLDLDTAYGPYTAVLGPVAATASSYLGGGHSAVPAAFSVTLAVLARSAATRKGERKK